MSWDDVGLDGRIDVLLLRPKSMSAFMAALFMVDAMVGRGHPIPELILPLMPGARQDRLNTEGDYLFTARSIARLINDRNFPSVVTLDPHSDVTPALLDHCTTIKAAECFKLEGFTRKWAAVVSPDAGAEKRALAVSQMLGVPLLHGWKHRDIHTGNLSGFGVEPAPDLEGGHVLVVDDLCDGGGTFVGLADVLDQAGFTADLYVTHGIFSRGTAPLLERFEHVYCTDSVLSDQTGATVIDTCRSIMEGRSE